MSTEILPEYEDRLLTGNEVAELFGVSEKTPSRWAKANRIAYVTTPGGHRRYPESAVIALLGQQGGRLRDPRSEFIRWIISLDDPAGPGFEDRRTVTLTQIIRRARDAWRSAYGD